MVEQVSPIIYQQIDTCIFARSGKETANQMLFYDSVSKNLIQIGDDSIKIFNRSATRLKKDIKLQLQKDKIYKIAVDKHNNYMLIFLETSKKQKILIVNLQTQKVINIFQGNFMALLGFFFIFNSIALAIKPGDDTHFSLVFNDRIVFYVISPSNGTDEVQEVMMNQIGDLSLSYVKYVYNQKYMVLCVQKSNNSFSFYNLSNVDFFSKQFEFKLLINPDNSKGSLFQSLLSLIKSDKETELSVPLIEAKDDYNKSHFLFEALYNKLYFIWQSYEDSLIVIYHIKDMNTYNKVTEIQLDDDLTTLQFIDNLILIHNFDKSETTVIDLKSEKIDKIFYKRSPMSSYDIIEENTKRSEKAINVGFAYKDSKDNSDDFSLAVHLDYNYNETISMMTYTNTSFYAKKIKVNGSIIEDRNEKTGKATLYNIYFDPLIYYQSSYSKYDALLNLTRRKDGKEVIIHGLFELIKSKRHIKKIRDVFQRIIRQIRKNSLGYHKTSKGDISLEGKDIISNQLISDSDIAKRSINDIPIPLQYILLKKKNIVVQTDIYYKLFKSFEFKPEVSPSYLITLLLIISNELIKQEITIQQGFFAVLILYLSKIEDLSQEAIYFQYHSIPDNKDVALFLIHEIGLTNQKTVHRNIRERACQIGIDMLKRLEENELLFETFIKMKQYAQALFLSQRHPLDKGKIDRPILEEMERQAEINAIASSHFISE